MPVKVWPGATNLGNILNALLNDIRDNVTHCCISNDAKHDNELSLFVTKYNVAWFYDLN